MNIPTVLFSLIFPFTIACGSVIDAQGKAQAKNLNEIAGKMKTAKGAEAGNTATALDALATGLDGGSLTLKKSKDLLKLAEDAISDGEISGEESAAIIKAIAENSKARKS